MCVNVANRSMHVRTLENETLFSYSRLLANQSKEITIQDIPIHDIVIQDISIQDNSIPLLDNSFMTL